MDIRRRINFLERDQMKRKPVTLGQVATSSPEIANTDFKDHDYLHLAQLLGEALADRPTDGSNTEMTSVIVAIEAIRRRTYFTRVSRSESVVQMNDSRLLRSVPTAGAF